MLQYLGGNKLHGGNLSKSQVSLFLLVIYASFASASAASNKFQKQLPKKQSIETILKSKKLRITKNERRVANNLHSLYKVSRQGHINKRIINRVLKDVKKYKTFYIFKPWAESLKNISKANTLKKIKKVCKQLVKSESINPLVEKLANNSKDLCFQKYLDQLAYRRIPYNKLKREMSYFRNYIKYYISRNNTGELNYLLSQYRNSPSRKKLISNTLSRYFVKSEIIPNSKTLQNMYINQDLTKFIQIKGMEETSTQRIIYSEYKALIKQAYESADKNDDARVVKGKVQKAVNYYNLTYAHLPQKNSSLKLIGLGKSLMRRSYFNSSRITFNAVIKNSNHYYEDALFENLWTYITQEEYGEAYEKVVKRYGLHKGFKSFTSSRLKFWSAYTMKEEDEDNFDQILLNVIETDPVSYYSIISSKFLEEVNNISSNKKYHNLLKQNDRQRYFTNLKIDDYTFRSLKRLKIWSLIDSKTFINSENRSLQFVYTKELMRKNQIEEKHKIKDFLTYLSAKVISTVDNHLEVFKVVYRGINNKVLKLDGDVLDLLYPKPYWNKIQKYSDSTDPVITLSLIRQESAFNRQARSHVGARGLMQLMPYTARRYKRRLRAKQLYNVNLNLRLGNKLLNQLMTQYEHNLVYVLSAYNAGEGRVKRWRTKYLTSDSILHNIENIPFSETRKYVKLIFRNIYFYKLMNDQSSQMNLADSSKPNKIFDVYLGFNQ